MYVPCTKGAPPNIALVVLMSLTLARMGEGKKEDELVCPWAVPMCESRPPSRRLPGLLGVLEA